MKRIRTLGAILLSVSALVAGGSAGAAPTCIDTPTGRPICIDLPGQPNPLCQQRDPAAGDGQQDPLCPNGQAECIAYGMYLVVDPAPGLPGGAASHLARSHAQTQAGAFNGYGYAAADADSSTQRADVPPALGEGVVESECHARSFGQTYYAYNDAYGRAESARLALDLTSYGAPVTVMADVLRETGAASTGGGGYNDANIADVLVGTPFGPVLVPQSAAPNTAIPLPGGLGTLYLNEQSVSVSPWGCKTFAGDALRLVVNRPGIGGQITLILSWVANAAC